MPACRLNRWLQGLALTGLALLAGCGRDAPAPPPAVVDAGLETVTVGSGGADSERLFDGIIEAVQQAALAAQTSGRIVALERDVDDAVARGGVILRINAVEQRARLDEALQAQSEAEARAIEARSAFQRTQQLFARKLLSEADLERATAARDAAEARLAAANAAVAGARQQFAYTEVRAPFAGVVTARHVEVGEAVTAGQPLAAVAALDALRLNVDVPQGLAEEIRRLGRARIHVGTRVIDSERLTVFPAAASGANTVRVRIDLPAGVADLFPGMFAKAGFQLGDVPNLVIPATAVVRRSEVTAVYVVMPDGGVALRQLRTGRQIGDTVEVLAGLAPGERIALDPVAATLVVERARRSP